MVLSYFIYWEFIEDLDGVLFGDEVDDFESVLDDLDGYDFFIVVLVVYYEINIRF